jgi:hypothetical protein
VAGERVFSGTVVRWYSDEMPTLQPAYKLYTSGLPQNLAYAPIIYRSTTRSNDINKNQDPRLILRYCLLLYHGIPLIYTNTELLYQFQPYLNTINSKICCE